MRRWWSAQDRRSASSTWLLLGISGLMVAGCAGGGLAWLLAGQPPMAQAGTAMGAPGPLAVLIVVMLAVLVGWGVGAVRWWWPSLMPTGEGFATRADVSKELSERAARKKAAVTRPSLPAAERRRVSADQIGIPFHETAWGQRCWLAFENPTGVLAPTQSGKSLTDLLHKVLVAPGALVTTSTKLDLFRLTALWRERLHGEGTVAVLDLTGTTGWPFQIRWNPLVGCESWRTATRRAKAFVAGVRPGDKPSGNHAFFENRAAEVLAGYMQAAVIAGAPLEVFVRWCLDDTDQTAADILLADPRTADHGMILRKAQNLVAETRDGIYESIRDAVSCLTDPLTRDMCVGGPQAIGFDVGKFLQTRGTVYVLGSEDTAADLAPLVTAFVENLLFEATQLALTQGIHDGRERLDPPLTAVLDELPNICPLPKIPSTISDSAGRGVLVHWAAQSRAQLVTAFGAEEAETLIDNTTALTVFGGLKSKDTLEWLSALCGRRIDERRSRKSEPLGVHLDRQISQERVELLTAGQIRELPAGRVLVIFRTMKPLIAVTRKGWELPEWPQLQADRREVIARALAVVEDNVTRELEAEGAPA